MKWTSIKSRVVLARTLLLTVEQVEGSNPWQWRIVALHGDRWPLFGGFSKNEANAKRSALEAARKELRIRKAKVQVLDQVEREWLSAIGGAP